MKRNEARRERFHCILELQEILLAQIIDPELCRREMDNLAIVEMNAQFLRENLSELPAAAAILTADRDDVLFLLHTIPSFKWMQHRYARDVAPSKTAMVNVYIYGFYYTLCFSKMQTFSVRNYEK